jgi:tRNA (cmo5U34)-methyltransferase
MAEEKVVTFESETRRGQSDAERDRLFAERRRLVFDFQFDGQTASVFDDMVARSVPFYAEIQRMISEMAADFATPGSRLYDLGCATGTTMLALDATVDPSVRFCGIDNSAEMLGQAEKKLEAGGVRRACELIDADLESFTGFENMSVALMVLTLQFMRPLRRQSVVNTIYDGLNADGCLILVEKLSFAATFLNRLFIKYYYDMKRRNGYSDVEISQKREALENVLVPYRPEENREMLRAAGFRHVEEFFRWYNFCGMIAVK